MLILLGGGWVAFWNVLMTPLVVKQLLEPGALNRPSSGEAVGYAIMVVMLTLLGLFVLLAGIGTVWSARKSGVRPPRRGSLSRTVGCALTGCAVAFMVQATPLAAPIYYVVAMFHEIDDTTLSITGLSITAVGAIAGIVVGRRFEAQ